MSGLTVMLDKVEERFVKSVETATNNLSKRLNDTINHIIKVVKDTPPSSCKSEAEAPAAQFSTSVSNTITEYMDTESDREM